MRRLADIQERAGASLDWPEAAKQAGQASQHAGLAQRAAKGEDREKALASVHLALGDLHDVVLALGARTAADGIGAAQDGLERAAGGEGVERTEAVTDQKTIGALSKIVTSYGGVLSTFMGVRGKKDGELSGAAFYSAKDAQRFLSDHGLDKRVYRGSDITHDVDLNDADARKILGTRAVGVTERAASLDDAEYEKGTHEAAGRLDAALRGVESRLQEDTEWLKTLAPELSFDDILADVWGAANVRWRGIVAEPGGDPHGKHHAHLVVTLGKKAGR